MRSLLYPFLIVISFALTACATSTPRFQQLTPVDGHGVLYVYRKNVITDGFLRANILAGGDSWFLGRGEYLAWSLPEGEYELKSACPQDDDSDICEDKLVVPVVSGQEHYVRFNPRAGKDIDESLSTAITKVSEALNNGKSSTAASSEKVGFLQYIARPQGRKEIENLRLAKP